MAIYVDQIRSHDVKGEWCHMCVEVGCDLEELHKFAESIGLKRAWFQKHPLHPHYDLRPSKRALAIERGAIELNNAEFIQTCSKYYQMKCDLCGRFTSNDNHICDDCERLKAR